jgi:predicted alpha/beta hydrolase family esterase
MGSLAVVDRAKTDPLILIVPENGAEHGAWSHYVATRGADAAVVDLGSWDEPQRNIWVNKLNLMIDRCERPVVLVASGLSCLAVAWWAEYERPAYGFPVVGALLLDPPSDRDGDPRVSRFGICPENALPFPSVVASLDAGGESRAHCSAIARLWSADFFVGSEPDNRRVPVPGVSYRRGSLLWRWIKGQRRVALRGLRGLVSAGSIRPVLAGRRASFR